MSVVRYVLLFLMCSLCACVAEVPQETELETPVRDEPETDPSPELREQDAPTAVPTVKLASRAHFNRVVRERYGLETHWDMRALVLDHHGLREPKAGVEITLPDVLTMLTKKGLPKELDPALRVVLDHIEKRKPARGRLGEALKIMQAYDGPDPPTKSIKQLENAIAGLSKTWPEPAKTLGEDTMRSKTRADGRKRVRLFVTQIAAWLDQHPEWRR